MKRKRHINKITKANATKATKIKTMTTDSPEIATTRIKNKIRVFKKVSFLLQQQPQNNNNTFK